MAAGDERAIEAFYRRYFDWLYSQARRLCRRDEAICLDVVQEAVLKIIRSIKQVESEQTLLAWMKLVVQTTVLDLWKQEARRKTREAVVAAHRSESETAPDAIDPDEQATQMAWLRGEIARLDPVLVEMIEMRFEKQWTLVRIGQWFGLSAGTIDGRLKRALKQLRQKATDASS